MSNKGRSSWVIDKQGDVHWRGKRGFTYCRRPTKRMQRSFAGDLFLTCEACRDLYKITKVTPK